MRIKEDIEQFLSELKSSGRSPRTITHYCTHLRLFACWLENSDKFGKCRDDDHSLNLDPRNIEVRIRFFKTSSPYFEEALRIAKELPGYRSFGKKMHEAKAPEALNGAGLWDRLKALADIVGHWKRSEVLVEGVRASNFWEFADSIEEVRQCFAIRKNGVFGDEYCLGKDAPDDEPRFFGCRLLQGVSLDIREIFQRQSRWYQFGKLSENLSTFQVDKSAILHAVENQTGRQVATTCPMFSWKRVRKEIGKLPDSIELNDTSPFEVNYSKIDPSKPLGIKLKNPPYPFRNPTINLVPGDGHKDEAQKRNIPNVRYSDIGAQDEALREVRNIVELPLKHPEYFTELGIEPQRGVILYGPPGNGKTLIAKAVATESKAHLEIINGPEILSKFVGESESNLREVFKRAKELEPSLVLIDEIDALAPSRAFATQQYQVSLISQLLVLLDGIEERGRVQVISTTNRIEAIDPAVRRPGRFDYHIEVPLPDKNGRLEILRKYLQKMKGSTQIDLYAIGARTEGFSGADLAGILKEAGLMAIKRALCNGIPPTGVTLKQADLHAALDAFLSKRT